jgi:hypothetical protein
MSKLAFDGSLRTITVLPGVTSLDIRADMWEEWINWQELNPNWPLALRYSGLDPIPGGESGGIFFIINNWKLIIDFTQTSVNGVLYSDDYSTAYWVDSSTPIYPATVSALVNNSVSFQNVVTGTALNAQEVRDAVWNAQLSSHTATGTFGEFIGKKLLTLAKFLGLK